MRRWAMKRSRWSGLVAAAFGLGLAMPAQAEPMPVQGRQPPTLEEQADEAARAMRDALARAMRLLEGVVDTIPQYELPEILPNGDIIIRRIPPKGAPPSPAPPVPPAPSKPGSPKLEET